VRDLVWLHMGNADKRYGATIIGLAVAIIDVHVRNRHMTRCGPWFHLSLCACTMLQPKGDQGGTSSFCP